MAIRSKVGPDVRTWVEKWVAGFLIRDSAEAWLSTLCPSFLPKQYLSLLLQSYNLRQNLRRNSKPYTDWQTARSTPA